MEQEINVIEEETEELIDITPEDSESLIEVEEENVKLGSDDYEELKKLPKILFTEATINDDRTVTLNQVTNTIKATQPIGNYGAYNFIQLDMTKYSASSVSKALIPENHLPDGTYVVTHSGWLRLDTDTKKMNVGSIIYWYKGELYLIGYNACEYWYYNEGDGWGGGYFTTAEDVESIVADKVGYEIKAVTTASGTVNMIDGQWIRRTRASGVTKLTLNFPNETPEYNYKSKITCKTASTFTTFTITAKDYDIYFTGDDCIDGVLTGVANKYYEIEARHDGFDGLLVKVHSH